MSRGRPGARQQRDPQYAFAPGCFGAAKRFMVMDLNLNCMVIPTATRDERIPSMAFPDLSAGEIAYLKGEYRKGYTGDPIIDLCNPEFPWGYQPVKWVSREEMEVMYPRKSDPHLDDILDRVLP